MKTRCFLFSLVLISLISCNHGAHNHEPGRDELSEESGASESTMLNPKFDENKLRGLGIFKIGSTFDATLGQLINSGRYSFDSLCCKGDSMASAGKTLAQYQIVKVNRPENTLEQDKMIGVGSLHTYALWCKETSTYFISEYDVDGLQIETLVAIYFNNRLVYIDCPARPELKKAFEAKYGKTTENHFADNGDIEGLYSAFAPSYSTALRITVKGALLFLYNCSDKDFEQKNAIDKENKAKGLKNL